MSDKTTEKKVLVLLISQFQNIAASVPKDYGDVVQTTDMDEGMKFIEEKADDISVIMIDMAKAEADDFKFLKAMKRRIWENIPVILIMCEPPNKKTVTALNLGAVDFILHKNTPVDPALTINRIENAIRIKNSRTFDEFADILKLLPSNVFLKDCKSRYMFMSHYWHHLSQDGDPNWSVKGKTDLDIRKDRENAIEAMKQDEKIIATGKGTRYTIKIDVDNTVEYYELIKEPIKNQNGEVTGIVGLINDITEHELLKIRLQRIAITDGLTGLYNRRTIQSKIDEFIGNRKPFSLVMIDIDNFKNINDTYGHSTGDEVIISLANIIQNGNMADNHQYISGRWGGEEFMIILDDANLQAASYIAELIRICFANTTKGNIKTQSVSIGVTEVKESDTTDSICSRVDAALYKAKQNGKNRVEIG